MQNHHGLPIDLKSVEALAYHYPDGSRAEIEAPARLTVTPTGEHCLVDISDVGIVVKGGWTHIEVYPRAGCLPFNE
jgi:hypothetical protein